MYIIPLLGSRFMGICIEFLMRRKRVMAMFNEKQKENTKIVPKIFFPMNVKRCIEKKTRSKNTKMFHNNVNYLIPLNCSLRNG